MSFYRQTGGAQAAEFSTYRAHKSLFGLTVDMFLIFGFSIVGFRSAIIQDWREDAKREDGEDNAWLEMEETT